MKKTAAPSDPSGLPRRLRTWLLVLPLAVLGIWVLFFDSHSLLQRVAWHHEHAALVTENTQLQDEIEALEASLETGLSDAEIEGIAREQYGMHKPGETVYHLSEDE